MSNTSRPDDTPSLLSDEELDRAISERAAAEAPRKPEREGPYPFPTIEAKFPRIASMILELWGKPELDSYLASLIIDDRGSRAGFPPDVLGAFLELSRQHQAQFRFAPPEDKTWTDDPLAPSRTRE